MMDGSGGMWFGGGLMWLLWIVLIAAVIYAIVAVVRGTSPQRNDGNDALEILRQRYARGEIDEEEFERRRRELES